VESAILDFPPTPSYVLDDDAATGPVTMPGPVAFQRAEHRHWRNAQVAVPTTDRRAALVCWLGRFGGKATRAACAHKWVHDVGWSNAASLRRLVAKDQDVIEHDFAAMVRELQRRGDLLASDAKSAKPNVLVVLHDERANRSDALPEPASLVAARKAPTRPPTALQ
jgi:hypothetical protein